jgi:hypothetical protein
MNQIKLIRLTSGEEILVHVVNESGLTLTVTDPVLLIPNKDKIGFMPYLSYCELDTMTIKKDHIMFNLVPTDDLKIQYKQMLHGTNQIQLNETPQILT